MDGQVERKIPGSPQSQIETGLHAGATGIKDAIGGKKEIEILDDPNQDSPFSTTHRGGKWQLSINRAYLEVDLSVINSKF